MYSNRRHATFKHRVFRRLAVGVSALLALASVGALSPSPADATTTGSYATTTNWYQDFIYNVRTVSYSHPASTGTATAFTIPASVPSTAVISTVTGSVTWSRVPSGMRFGFALCLGNGMDTANCTGVTFLPVNTYGWTFSSPAFSGMNAKTTQIHFVAYIDDGSTGNIYQAVNPSIYLTATNNRNFTVNYTY